MQAGLRRLALRIAVGLLIATAAVYAWNGFRYVKYEGRLVDVYLSHDAWVHLTATADLKKVQVYRTGFQYVCVSGLDVTTNESRSLHPDAPGWYEDRGLCLTNPAIEKIQNSHPR